MENWVSSGIRKWNWIEQLAGSCNSVDGSNLEFPGAIFSLLVNLCTAQAVSWRTKVNILERKT